VADAWVEEPALVLLVGAPRSGTTWLQRMLAAHPSVASPQETDLFARYLEPLADAWAWQQRGGPDAWKARRYKGLPAVLTSDEFTTITRDYVQAIVARAAALRPGASIVLEKSPSTSLCADAIAQLTPDARVLHLVRDGRDVAASLLAASEGWGRWWAPRTLPDAARAWVRHVEGARRADALGVPYLEVRYEALVAGDAGLLRAAHDFCGIATTEAECKELLDRFSFDRTAASGLTIGGEFAEAGAGWDEPEGFNRRGVVEGWTSEWGTRDRLQFDAIAGGLLVTLGYEPDHRWAADPMRTRVYRFEAAASAAVARSTRWLGKRGERLAARNPRG
jgi:hypothetical protein